MSEIKEGAILKIPYPFVRATYTEMDFDGEKVGSHEIPCWKPGIKYEAKYSYRECEDAYADAMGFQVLTIVSIHKPGKYQERVFYTRQWQDPDGKIWGKTDLRLKSLRAISRDLKGYRYPFAMNKEEAA